jgi:hypothetical protein
MSESETNVIAEIALLLSHEYQADSSDPWANSSFRWIKSQPSRRIGTIGERLVEEWAKHHGFAVERSPNSEADRIINGHRIEIKLSTLWASGIYKFQQIRDQDYEYCFCIGISPFEVHAWLIPKAVLQQYVIGHMGQHTGAEGSDTAWIGFQVGQEYDWMKPFGNSLESVKELLLKLE